MANIRRSCLSNSMSDKDIIKYLYKCVDGQFEVAPNEKKNCIEYIAAKRIEALVDALDNIEAELLACKEANYRTRVHEYDMGHEKIHHQTILHYSKLLATLQDVSGNVDAFTWDKLKQMSAAYFLNILSPNMQMTFSSWHKEKK